MCGIYKVSGLTCNADILQKVNPPRFRLREADGWRSSCGGCGHFGQDMACHQLRRPDFPLVGGPSFLCWSISAGTGNGEGHMSVKCRQSKYRDLEILSRLPVCFVGHCYPEDSCFFCLGTSMWCVSGYGPKCAWSWYARSREVGSSDRGIGCDKFTCPYEDG